MNPMATVLSSDVSSISCMISLLQAADGFMVQSVTQVNAGCSPRCISSALRDVRQELRLDSGAGTSNDRLKGAPRSWKQRQILATHLLSNPTSHSPTTENSKYGTLEAALFVGSSIAWACGCLIPPITGPSDLQFPSPDETI